MTCYKKTKEVPLKEDYVEKFSFGKIRTAELI